MVVLGRIPWDLIGARFSLLTDVMHTMISGCHGYVCVNLVGEMRCSTYPPYYVKNIINLNYSTWLLDLRMLSFS